MPERIKQIWSRIKDFFKNMNKRVRIALIAVAGLAVIALAALAVYNVTRPYVTLFSGLSPEDLTAVVSYLDTANVRDYQIVNTDTVRVRENQADALRAQIVMQGYPTSGYGYGTYLDNVSSLSSASDRQQLALYDLQERLGRTIRCFDGVQDAEVYITPGEDRRYILSESVVEASAGVHVQMQTGKTLTRDQVTAIQHLVASAQQGLTFSNVEVSDNAGNSYTSEAGSLSETAEYKLALERQVNEQVRNSIMRVLVPYFGVENVEVTVSSTVDVSHTYKESVIYEQEENAVLGSQGSMGIIGTQVWDNSLVRGGDTAAGGVVGTSTNTEINEYVTREGAVRGDESEVYGSGEIEYDVTHHNVQTDQPPGTITDLTVAIAVNSTRVNIQNPASFIHLAATAAGISSEIEAEKIAIVSYPFYQSSSGGVIGGETMIFGLPSWVVYAAIAGIALFLAMLLIILLLRNGKRKQKRAAELQAQREAEEAEAMAAALAAMPQGGEGADIMDLHAEESMQMRKDVRRFVEENPSIAAQMVKNWLRGGEEP